MWWDPEELAKFALDECIQGDDSKKNRQLILKCKPAQLKDKLICKYCSLIKDRKEMWKELSTIFGLRRYCSKVRKRKELQNKIKVLETIEKLNEIYNMYWDNKLPNCEYTGRELIQRRQIEESGWLTKVIHKYRTPEDFEKSLSKSPFDILLTKSDFRDIIKLDIPMFKQYMFGDYTVLHEVRFAEI